MIRSSSLPEVHNLTRSVEHVRGQGKRGDCPQQVFVQLTLSELSSLQPRPSQPALHGSVQAKSKATENNAENSFPAFGLLPPEEAETTAISTQPNVDRSVRGDLRIVAALNECRGKSRYPSVGSVLQIRQVERANDFIAAMAVASDFDPRMPS